MIKTVIDWESAYGIHPDTGENITLVGVNGMTTEEYVRHPLFKVHGLGIKIDNDPAFYLYKPAELLHFLKTHPWGRSLVVAHNAHFDGAILTWRFGIKPAFWCDTLSMARAIFPQESNSLEHTAHILGVGTKGKELETVKGLWNLNDEQQAVLGGYCATNPDSDVNLTHRIFHSLTQHFCISEFKLIDLNIRLFTEPVLEIEPGILIEDFKREKRNKRALIKQCGVTQTVVSSNDQFAKVLWNLGVDPPKKISPSKVKDGRVDPDEAGEKPVGLLPSWKIPKGTLAENKAAFKKEKDAYPWAYAFSKNDEEFNLLREHPDKRIIALVEARIGAKSTIKETRSKRFYKIGKRGKFPVYHKYYGAKTGRDSGGDRQNTTNLNRVNHNDPTSGALRKSMFAPPGHMIVVRDLGQIEARMLAYHAGQEDLLDLFRAGGDPYNRQASLIFGYEVDRKLPQFTLEGMAGKASVLGNGYGLGWATFQEGLRKGFLGMPPLLFSKEDALKLDADIDVFCHQRSYAKGCATLRDQALKMRPLNVGETEHLWHCAAVKSIVDKYRESNPFVVFVWKEMHNALAYIIDGIEIQLGTRGLIRTHKDGLVLPNGMLIRYPDLKKHSDGEYSYLANTRTFERTYIYGGKGVENCIQALSRIVLTDQMLEVDRRLKQRVAQGAKGVHRVVTSTYDEIVCVVPEEFAEEQLYIMEEIMATPPSWCPDLPLKSSGGYARNYGDCEK